MTNPVHVTAGLITFPLEFICAENTFTISSLVARRELFEQVGGFPYAFHYGCDHEITARLFAVGRPGFLPRPYMTSLIHDEQDSAHFWVREGFQLKHLLTWQMIVKRFDLPYYRKYIYNGLGHALFVISTVLRMQKHHRAALHHAVWAFRVRPSFKMLWNIVHVVYTATLKKPFDWSWQVVDRVALKIRRILSGIKQTTLRAIGAK